jgi:hypothetical protein
MNCKPGDLAVHKGGIYGAKSRNIGKMVRLGKFIGRVAGFDGNDRWELIERSIVSRYGKTMHHARDCYLSPIRPQSDEVQDETLQWLPVPSVEKETA